MTSEEFNAAIGANSSASCGQHDADHSSCREEDIACRAHRPHESIARGRCVQRPWNHRTTAAISRTLPLQ